jgi:hypothetical protein
MPGKVLRNNPCTAEALQNEIINVIVLLMADELHRVLWGFL